jgi:hypothetical protein
MRNGLVVCGLFAVLTARAGSTSAQQVQSDPQAVSSEVARAEGFAADAYEAYERQDFAQAVALYRRALAASPSPDIVYNLARIYDAKLKDRAHAIEFYERYTNDPGADPERARTALERLAGLRELEQISASKRAAANSSTPTSVTSTTVQRGAEVSAPETPAEPAHSGLSGLQVASIVVGTAGLAGVGVGIGFGLDAKSNADRSHQLCDGNLCFTPEGVNAAKHASRSATISTIAFIGGGALVVAGVTMLILGSIGETEREARVQLVPYADRYGGGTQLIGRW